MKKSRFTEEQIIRALQQLDGGIAAKDVARDLGVNAQTLYRWRKKFGGMDVSDARRLRHLEDENRRLKRLVAELTLDKQALQDIASRKW
jgi:putative transposase